MLFKAQVTCSGCAGVGELYDYEILARGGKGWRHCPMCGGEGIVEASITIEDLAESLRGLLHSQGGA